MYDIIAILIPIVLAVCIVVAIRIVSDYKLHKQFIESKTDAETVRIVLETARDNRQQSILIWGVMTMFVGLALCAIGLLGMDSANPLVYGLIFLATGAALVLHKKIIAHLNK